MSLRRAFLLFGSALGVIGLLGGASLLVLTIGLHRMSVQLEDTVESIAITEALELELVTYRNLERPIDRLAAADRILLLAGEAERYVSDAPEAALLAELKRHLKSDTQAVDRAWRGELDVPVVEQTRPEFEAAFRSARALIDLNVQQGRTVRRSAARWDQLAGITGTALVVVIVGVMLVLVVWLKASLFQPAVELSRAIDRFARGGRSSRAPERGAHELRLIAQRFNEMAVALDEQRQRQLAFLGGVAHDLKTPLQALKLACAMVAPDAPLPPEERVRQSFARVQRQIGQLERMVHDLLDGAGIEAGRLELRMERCDGRELIRATMDLFEPTAPGHRLVTSVPDQPVPLSCDRTRMKQVLTNLVSNAIKYSPSGGLVRASIDAQAGWVRLAVADQGVGMSAEDLEHLFEPFRRSGGLKESIPGAGLGLFVAQKIVEAHGGKILVESAPGAGSVFSVQLPLPTAQA